MIKFFEKDNKFNNCDYINNKVVPGLTKSNFPVCFFKIVSIFADDSCNQITKLYTMHNTLWIEGSYKGKINELMLRYKYSDDNIGFVVARICFINQRIGNFSKLMSVIEDIKEQYKLGETMIECANTDEILNWIKKNNWVKYKSNNYISKDAYERIINKNLF